MLPNFIYIPAEGQKKAFWLNLSLVSKINEYPEGRLTLYGVAAVPLDLEGHQAEVLRLHLQGRAMSHRPEPELPAIPRSAIPAAEQLEARLERRGVIQ